MHKEVLKPEQIDILPLIKLFKKDFYLVGGTAIALYLGHRYSLDFDLFTETSLKRKSIKNFLLKNNYKIQHILFEDSIQLHCIIENVKITFYQFPFKINAANRFDNVVRIPDLLTLAAMKAFALGGRNKWKDYVDLYFLLKFRFTYEEIVDKAVNLFHNAFNDKLFKQQLSYFDDVNFQEEVEFLNEPVPEEDIKNFLTEISLTPF